MRACTLLLATAASLLVSACAASTDTPEDGPSTGTVAPDAGVWEQLVDEATGMQFDFPVRIEPEEHEVGRRGEEVPVHFYQHISGSIEVVLMLEPTDGLLLLDGSTMVRNVQSVAEQAGDTRVRCSDAHGSKRRQQTTCRSVDADGKERISRVVVQSWPGAVATSYAGYTALDGEELTHYLVQGTIRKLTGSLTPGAAVA